MLSSNFIRWSGLAALVGGLLTAILSILESAMFGSQPDSSVMMSSAWIVVEVFFLVAMVLIILSLFGMYEFQAEKAGSFGVIAFLTALTGTVMLSGLQWSTAFMAPWITEIATPELLNDDPTGIFMIGILLTFVLFAVGWLLFGLASLQAGVLSRGAAVLLMVGAILFLVMGFLELGFEVVVFGAALAWLGYTLWSGVNQPGLPAKAVTM